MPDGNDDENGLRTSPINDADLAALRRLVDRVATCSERYWTIDKRERIDQGLRQDIGLPGYSGDTVLAAVDHTLRQALHFGFPVTYDRNMKALAASAGFSADPIGRDDEAAIQTPSDLYEILNPEVVELESLLDLADTRLRQPRDS